MVDREDDIRMGSRSTAILFGDIDQIAIGVLQVGFLASLALVGSRAELGLFWYVGLGVAGLLIAWQFWMARDRSREHCFRAFLHNNWVGMVIFVGLVFDHAKR
jgi:4-hydroxybenzoate polyprenyltransferase